MPEAGGTVFDGVQASHGILSIAYIILFAEPVQLRNTVIIRMLTYIAYHTNQTLASLHTI